MSGKAHRGRKRDRRAPRIDDLVGIDPNWTGDLSVDEYVSQIRDDGSTRKRAVDVHPPGVPQRHQLAGDDPQPAHSAQRPAAGLTHPDPGSRANRHVPHDTPDNGQ